MKRPAREVPRERDRATANNAPLVVAFDAAVSGDFETLEKFLCRTSRLPGEHANVELARAFAELVASRGKQGDKIALRLALLPPDQATATTAREFLPMCGALGLGASAAKHVETRRRFLAVLHELSEDFRYRVRDMVPLALAMIGEATGDALFEELEGWSDGFFHVAALLRGATEQRWLGACRNPAPYQDVLRRAFRLLADAPRSLERYPGYKSLVEAIPPAVRAFAHRFGTPIYDVVAEWVAIKEPMLRDMIEASLKSLSKVAPDEVKRIRSGLAATAPVPRDPTIIRHGTRGRGKKRRSR